VRQVVVGSLHVAQPAMIYLVPGTLLPFAWVARRRGELEWVWEGLKSHQRLHDEDEGSSYP
jgi:hypothetical protein